MAAADEIEAPLRALGTPERAEGEKRYLKSSLESKTRPYEVFDWLLPRASRASGVTMREALKYLSPERRQALGR